MLYIQTNLDEEPLLLHASPGSFSVYFSVFYVYAGFPECIKLAT